MSWMVDDVGQRIFVDVYVIYYSEEHDQLVSRVDFELQADNCDTSKFKDYPQAMRYLSKNPDLPERQRDLWLQALGHGFRYAYLVGHNGYPITKVSLLPANLRIFLESYSLCDGMVDQQEPDVINNIVLGDPSSILYGTLKDAVSSWMSEKRAKIQEEELSWNTYIERFVGEWR